MWRWIRLLGEIPSGSLELVLGSDSVFLFSLGPLEEGFVWGNIPRLMLSHVDHMGPYTILFSCISPPHVEALSHLQSLQLVLISWHVHQIYGILVLFLRKVGTLNAFIHSGLNIH